MHLYRTEISNGACDVRYETIIIFSKLLSKFGLIISGYELQIN